MACCFVSIRAVLPSGVGREAIGRRLEEQVYAVAKQMSGQVCKSTRLAGFIGAISMILALLSPHAVAGVNDDAFNECLQILHQSHYALTDDSWRSSRLPSNVEKIVRSNLFEESIGRWIDHKNQNGSMTYVVRTHEIGTDPPDVIFEQGNTASVKDSVSANAFAFSATQRHGVNGLLFCAHDEISDAVWNWTGSDWSPN